MINNASHACFRVYNLVGVRQIPLREGDDVWRNKFQPIHIEVLPVKIRRRVGVVIEPNSVIATSVRVNKVPKILSKVFVIDVKFIFAKCHNRRSFIVRH